jgi:hypothetical protein
VPAPAVSTCWRAYALVSGSRAGYLTSITTRLWLPPSQNIWPCGLPAALFFRLLNAETIASSSLNFGISREFPSNFWDRIAPDSSDALLYQLSYLGQRLIYSESFEKGGDLAPTAQRYLRWVALRDDRPS